MIAWDVPVKVNNVSLKTCLLKLLNLLANLLCNIVCFKEKPIALCDDLTEMFHQVLIRNADQSATTFLWGNGDSPGDLDIYVMQV